MLSYQQCLLATMLCSCLLRIMHSVCLLAGEDDLRDVRSAVADLTGRWMDLGISLGMRRSDLDHILSANPHSPSNCLTEMLTLWLRQSYTVSITFVFHPFYFIY